MRTECVKPLRAYGTPAYPTIEEIGRVDLSLVPSRWSGLKVVASTLGAAAMGLKALALEASEAVKPVASVPVAAVPDAKAPKEVKSAVVTDVCPLPAKEIAGDGSGAFGCVAMNPPVILPEGEALDLIEKEFAERGIRLTDGHVLEDVEMIKKGWKMSRKEGDDLWKGKIKEVTPQREKRRLLVDLGTKDGSLLVEYVSDDDQGLWVYDPWEGSSVSHVTTRKAAERMVEGLKKRTKGQPVKVAVFYDPCAYVPEDFKPVIPEGTKKADVWRIRWNQERAKGKEIARKQLTAQIEAFFTYMAKRSAHE